MKGKLIKTNIDWLLVINSNQVIGSINEPDISKGVQKLSIKNCEAIERGYDLFELAHEACNITDPLRLDSQKYKQDPYFMIGFNKGFQKALEILGDKKFSETELYRAFLINSAGDDFTLNQFFNNTVLPMFQQTEWDVEIEEERSKFITDKSLRNDIKNGWNYTQKLDAEGNLILKRI